MKEKKGIQLSQAVGAVLTLVLVAVLVIIAIVIFVSLSSSFAGTATGSTNLEAVTATTGGTAVANASLCEFASLVVTGATNSTGSNGVAMDAANYTVVAADGTIANTTTQETDSAEGWLVNYTYVWGSEACTASDNMTSEFSNYTSLIGLVGTIIFLGLVIGVLVASFAFGGNKV